MLSTEQNDLITRTGPGTPAGRLMRRYWQPAALADELKAHVQARLSKHKYPRWVVFVDDLPKNDRGKVDKKLLIERDRRGELAETR